MLRKRAEGMATSHRGLLHSAMPFNRGPGPAQGAFSQHSCLPPSPRPSLHPSPHPSHRSCSPPKAPLHHSAARLSKVMKATWVRSSPGRRSRQALMASQAARSMPEDTAAYETSIAKT